MEQDIPNWASVIPHQLRANSLIPSVEKRLRMMPPPDDPGPGGDSSCLIVKSSPLEEKAEQIK